MEAFLNGIGFCSRIFFLKDDLVCRSSRITMSTNFDGTSEPLLPDDVISKSPIISQKFQRHDRIIDRTRNS